MVKKILKRINEFKKRIFMKRFNGLLSNLLFMMGISIFSLALISRFVSMVELNLYIGWILKIILTAAIFGGLMVYPRTKKVLKTMDGLGLEDRMLTFWEFRDSDYEYKEEFYQEVDDSLKNIDIKRINSGISIKKLIAFSLLVISSYGCISIATPASIEADELKGINQEIAEESKIVEENEKRLAGSEEALSELMKLEDELKDSYNFREAKGSVGSSIENLDEMVEKNRTNKRILEKSFLSESYGQGKEISRAINKEDYEEAKALIDQISDKEYLKELSDKLDSQGLLEKKTGLDSDSASEEEVDRVKDELKDLLDDQAEKTEKEKDIEAVKEELEGLKEKFDDRDKKGFEGQEGTEENDEFIFGKNKEKNKAEASSRKSKNTWDESAEEGNMNPDSGRGSAGKGGNSLETDNELSYKDTEIELDESNEEFKADVKNSDKGNISTGEKTEAKGVNNSEEYIASYVNAKTEGKVEINILGSDDEEREFLKRYYEALIEGEDGSGK